MTDRYAEKENYVHDMTVGWRRKHIYATLFEENRVHLADRAVLMLGCNAGTTLALLEDFRPARLVGVDLNAVALGKARGVTSAELICANFIEDALDLGQFDTILLLDVLEHIYPEDRETLQRDLLRWLRPLGNLLIFTPSSASPYAHDPQHVVIFDEPGEVPAWFPAFDCVELRRETRPNPGMAGEHNSFWCVLRRPDPPPEREVVVIVGLPGAGKTPLARQMVTHQLISTDALWHGGGLKTVYELIQHIAAAVQEYGRVVVDGWWRWNLEWASKPDASLDVLEAAVGCPVRVIVVTKNAEDSASAARDKWAMIAGMNPELAPNPRIEIPELLRRVEAWAM